MKKASPNALSRLLLMQAMLHQMRGPDDIFAFVCRGLNDMPGVASAHHDPAGSADDPGEAVRSFAIHVSEHNYGRLVIELAAPDAFEPYSGYIQNIAFMIAVLLEERRLSSLMEDYNFRLEAQVSARTADLRMTEAVVREENERAERYLKVSEAVIVELDQVGNIVVLNDRGYALLDYPPGSLLGKNWLDLVIPGDQRVAVRSVFRNMIEGKSTGRAYFDNSVLSSSGERFHVTWHNELVRDRDGEITGTISSGIDITERKAVEEAVVSERQRFATTFRCLSDGVITTNESGAIVSMNPAAEEMTGCNAADAVGVPLVEVIKAGGGDGFRYSLGETIERILSGCSGIDRAEAAFELEGRTDARKIECSLARINTEDGVSGVVLTLRDVSHIIKLAELTQRSARLESLALLAGGVAHDLNNLIGPIVALPDIVEEDVKALPDLPDEPRSDILESLSVMRNSALQSAAVIKDLSTMGHRGVASLHPLDLNERVQASLSNDLNRAKGGDENAPPIEVRTAPQPLPIMGDANALVRVIDNLLINAREVQGGDGAITLKTERVELETPYVGHEIVPPGQYAVVSVTDTGAGIEEDDVSRIFEPFFSKKSRSEKSGSGLGLAIVHGLVKDHKGYIDVITEPGKGSQFVLYFDLIDESTLKSDDESDQRSFAGSGRVLVVDDEPSQRYLARRGLVKAGYEVTEAASGREAVSLVREALTNAGKAFDLVVLDMVMEDGFDGLDTHRAILELCPDIPVVIASGHAENDRSTAAMGLGASWIAKPYPIAVLQKEVGRRLAAV